MNDYRLFFALIAAIGGAALVISAALSTKFEYRPHVGNSYGDLSWAEPKELTR